MSALLVRPAYSSPSPGRDLSRLSLSQNRDMNSKCSKVQHLELGPEMDLSPRPVLSTTAVTPTPYALGLTPKTTRKLILINKFTDSVY